MGTDSIRELAAALEGPVGRALEVLTKEGGLGGLFFELAKAPIVAAQLATVLTKGSEPYLLLNKQT